jgi:pseudouridine synthase
MRIQKYLSEQNILSRRKAEEYLKKGFIKINGKVVTELGTKIDPAKDKIEFTVDIAEIKKQYIYLAFNKPKGIVTNLPTDNEKEISDLLPQKYKHISPIGRLDKDTEGLILLTDDGIFAKSILNAKIPHEREYLVKINIPLTDAMKNALEKGVYILHKKTKPAKISKITNQNFLIILSEGKNRQIRRMLFSVGAIVTYLKRIRFGKIILGDLPTGEYRIIDPKSLNLEE